MIIKNLDSIGNYVDIQPIKANFTDAVNANIFTIYMHDDTIACVVDYKLYNLNIITEPVTLIGETEPKEITTINTQLMFSGSVTINGEDYTNWSGDSEYVYNFVANHLGLTII